LRRPAVALSRPCQDEHRRFRRGPLCGYWGWCAGKVGRWTTARWHPRLGSPFRRQHPDPAHRL